MCYSFDTINLREFFERCLCNFATVNGTDRLSLHNFRKEFERIMEPVGWMIFFFFLVCSCGTKSDDCRLCNKLVYITKMQHTDW